MEGEKEREREQGEEKESDEAEEEYEEEEEEDQAEEEDPEGAALVWQEGPQQEDQDELGLPIMHWEALSLRIAELEKQEEEKKKNAKQHSSSSCLERGRTPVSWTEDRDRGRSQRDMSSTCWEDTEDDCNSRVMALTSRLGTHMNLQLCFINNSESEEDEEDEDDNKKKAVKRGTVQVPNPPQTAPAVAERTKPSRSFKNALRSLRDRLRTDHKQQVPAVGGDSVVTRRTLERRDLVAFSIKELNALCGSLSQAIQELSTELVGRLQTRDQLRTEQDAMLVEVQDLTSL